MSDQGRGQDEPVEYQPYQGYESYQGYQGYDSHQGYQPTPQPTTTAFTGYDQQGQPVYAPVLGPTYGVALAAQQPTHPQAATVFVLGLLSILGFPIVGPIAIAIGNKARQEMRESDRYQPGLLTPGWVLGIIGTIMFALSVLSVAVFVIMMFAFSQGVTH